MDEKKQIDEIIDRYIGREISPVSLALYLHVFRSCVLRSGEWFNVANAALMRQLCIPKDTLKKAKKELINKGYFECKSGVGHVWLRIVPLY